MGAQHENGTFPLTDILLMSNLNDDAYRPGAFYGFYQIKIKNNRPNGHLFLRRWRPHDEERQAAYYYASRRGLAYCVALCAVLNFDYFDYLSNKLPWRPMKVMASKITTIQLFVLQLVQANNKKDQSSSVLDFCEGNHLRPVDITWS